MNAVTLAKTTPLVWTSTATLLPDPGTLVLFTLRASRIPRAGYYDTVRTYLDRVKHGDEEKDFALDRWWTSALDEDDYWEVESVAYWCEFLDVPPLNAGAVEARAEAITLLRIAVGVEAPMPFPPRCAKAALEIISEHERFAKDLADLNEVLRDKRRLARELDVKLNGAAGAAKSPGLVDILAQFSAACECGTALLAGWKQCPRCGKEA